ncbi:unnamed protein product [Pleuronectes platessa]|uniref:Uncharacterized protein n=1 Tax=Pleuronectes platessa TaxID=8262 RepID=A0A9N7YB27_PLEPL|nr:unnamed protein product [Pleuronectes platessa]
MLIYTFGPRTAGQDDNIELYGDIKPPSPCLPPPPPIVRLNSPFFFPPPPPWAIRSQQLREILLPWRGTGINNCSNYPSLVIKVQQNSHDYNLPGSLSPRPFPYTPRGHCPTLTSCDPFCY